MKSFFNNKPNAHNKTIVILGAARSGTSIVSSILHHSGVYMGDFGNSHQYEDTQLNYSDWEGKIEEEKIRNFRKIIRERNENYKIWGWKDINTIWYLKKILPLLINPVFIFTSRSPLHIGYSSYVKDKNHHEVPDNYRFLSFRSAVRQVSKHLESLNPNRPIAVLDFNELQNKIVTKPLLNWLGIDYNKKCDDAIGESYTEQFF